MLSSKKVRAQNYIYIYKERKGERKREKRKRGGERKERERMLIFVENNIVHKLRTNDAW
jgi:hypothetical protein